MKEYNVVFSANITVSEAEKLRVAAERLGLSRSMTLRYLLAALDEDEIIDLIKRKKNKNNA